MAKTGLARGRAAKCIRR